MGRPERSVDVESGPVARLACDLRALRQAVGGPSYRILAARANYSATVLSRAASGRELPSLPVLLAYVTACGGNPAEWEVRWRAMAGLSAAESAGHLENGVKAESSARANPGVAAESGARADPSIRALSDTGPENDGTAQRGPGDPEPEHPDPGEPVPDADAPHGMTPRATRNAGSSRPRLRALVLTVAVASGWAVALSGFAWDGGGAARTSAGRMAVDTKSAPVTPAAISDGDDPVESGCAAAAVTVAQAMVRLSASAVIAGMRHPAGTPVGLVELRYSARCRAAWTRATPTPGYAAAPLGTVTVVVTRQSDGTSASFRGAGMTLLYGDLLLTRGGCLTAAAAFRFTGGGLALARTACWARS